MESELFDITTERGKLTVIVFLVLITPGLRLLYQTVKKHLRSHLWSYRYNDRLLGELSEHMNLRIAKFRAKKCYSFPKSGPLGRVLIINNEKSQLHSHLFKEREGSANDVTSLKTAFKRLNFRVDEYLNLCDYEMMDKVRQFLGSAANNPDDKGCNVVVLMSHGNYEGIQGTNGRLLRMRDILQEIESNQPRGRLTFLVVNACRDTPLQPPPIQNGRGNSHTSNIYSSTRSPPDFIVTYSTWPGFYSLRHREQGSYFIQSLTSLLDVPPNTDAYELMDFMEEVSKRHNQSVRIGCEITNRLGSETNFYFPVRCWLW